MNRGATYAKPQSTGNAMRFLTSNVMEHEVAERRLHRCRWPVKREYDPNKSKTPSLIGSRFGRWIVLSFSHVGYNHRKYWLCRCDCGTERIIAARHLVSGESRSCGCLHRERVIKHGGCRRDGKRACSAEYAAWRGMLHRCENQTNKYWYRYGGRGISVCPQWHKFENFLADMRLKPSPDLSLERIDNDAGYSPANCKWATAQEQNANRHCAKSYERKQVAGKPKRKDSTSKFKGVSFFKRDGVWQALIGVSKGKAVYLGRFATEIEAARAFNEASRKYHGSAGFLNDIPG